MSTRIAINLGGGYVPGLNAVITGAVLAASRLDWDVVGIRGGYEGLLFPDRDSEGGVVKLTPATMENLATGCILGTASRTDPFHVRTVNAENAVEEVDRSDELLPYHRFGESKYGFLGRVYELEDFTPPTPETLHRLQAIIDEAFGRSGTPSRERIGQ